MVMVTEETRRSPEEFARLGDEIYEQSVIPHVGAGDHGKFVAIDITSGDYAIDRDELAAIDQLRARRPAAEVWMRRIGFRHTHRFGLRSTPSAS